MAFLSPRDILSLRKVSKSLADITRKRSVWIHALRCVCMEHDVYAPSFSLAEMSIHELEHTATASRRFTSHVWTNFRLGRTVAPLSIRYMEPLALGEGFQHPRLIPGGRYLIAVFHCTLHLWDLANESNIPSTSFTIDGVTEIRGIWTRNCTPDVLVFVSTTGFDSVFRCHVFSVFPPASMPHFRLFAPVLSLPIANSVPNILYITTIHVAVGADSSIVLWNYVHDSWVSWVAPLIRTNDDLFLCHNNVVMFFAAEAEVHVASIPTLSPRSGTMTPPEIDTLPIVQKFQVRRYDQAKPLISCVGANRRLFHGRETITVEQPLHIDIMSLNATKLMITHFALLPAASENTSLCELVALGESPLEISYYKSRSLFLEWINPSMVADFEVEDNLIHLSLMAIRGTESTFASGVLEIPELLANDGNSDFCLFSGRTCARIPSGTGFKMMIMDYLMPPPH